MAPKQKIKITIIIHIYLSLHKVATLTWPTGPHLFFIYKITAGATLLMPFSNDGTQFVSAAYMLCITVLPVGAYKFKTQYESLQ